MSKSFRRVQFLSNIATIVIALLLSFIVVRQYIFPPSEAANGNVRKTALTTAPQKTAAPVSPVGKTVPLQNVSWQENKKTLILYVSTTCRFCTESSPFYQRLVKENTSKNVKLVAVLTQPVDQAKEYLKKLDVNIQDVYSTSFSSIGVSATPTLMLVDDAGVVSEYWRGKLTPEKETEVLSKLSS